MEFLPEAIENYAKQFSIAEDAVLAELNRETYAKVMMPRMLSGHIQGNLLRLFCQMIQPKHVLEIGTYTGYSAICMAQGMPINGILHTIDINEELEDMVRKYVIKAGFKNKIKQHIGNALEIIPTLHETFDLVFIDADKVNYANYFDLVINQVKQGGFIIADNVLWSGKVLNDKKDKDTAALHKYNQKIASDPRVEHNLFPIRDGLMVARKL